MKRADSIDDMKNCKSTREDWNYDGDIINYDEIIRFEISFFHKQILIKPLDRLQTYQRKIALCENF